MSRLIKQLRQVSESIAPTLGFKTATTTPTRLMLIIAALPKSDTSQIAKITEAEVDAILVNSQDLEGDLQTLRQIPSIIKNTPWGVWSETMTDEGIKELGNIGGDFLIFVASRAPATLVGEEIGKIINLSPPLDDGLIRTIDQLPIDALLLDFRGKGGSITVSHLMDCQQLTGSTRKPVMVAVDQWLGDKELKAFWEAGVNGMVVEVEDESQAELMRLRQAISALPQTTRKSAEQGVILPSLERNANSVPPEEI